MHRLFTWLFMGVLLLPGFASAQEAPAFLDDIESEADLENLTLEQRQELDEYFLSQEALSSSELPGGAVDCFDYYTFNSVQVDVSPALVSTVPGVPLTFTGEISNENPYPITDGSVFVKIFRTDTDGNVQSNGYPVVDSFFAAEDITIPADTSEPFSFEWDVPRYLSSGDYEADMFFLVGKKFNLLGLSFTDDVTGNKASFSVISDAPEVPTFDKDAVTLNGEPHTFAAFLPHFDKDEAVEVDVVLENPSNETKTVDVAWTLHNWSAEMEGSLLDTETETVTLAPGERKSLRYVADPALSTGSVTYLRAEVKYEDTKSILGVRFVRDGFDEIRLNFPGLMKYPVQKGEENTIFSCLHSTNADLVEGAKLTLTLTDSFGTVLDSHVYDGDISGAMMATKHDFTPGTSSSTFTLSARLEKDGRTLETYETTYDCEDIDPSLCQLNQPLSLVEQTQETLSTSVGARVLFGLFILVPLGLIIWLLSKRSRGGVAGLALLIALGSCIAADGAEAKSVVYSTNKIPSLYQVDQKISGDGAYYGRGLLGLKRGTNVSVQYSADLYDGTTGKLIEDGSNVEVGTVLVLKPKEHRNADINWTGTGYASDTPYGFWGINKSTDYFYKWGGRVPTTTNRNIAESFEIFEGRLSTYQQEFPLVLDLPETSFSAAKKNTAGLSCNESGSVCTVISAGDIELSVDFSRTFGRFYDAYDNYTGALRTFLSECLDSKDNDGDGLIDEKDPECVDVLDWSLKEEALSSEEDREWKKRGGRSHGSWMRSALSAYTLYIPEQAVEFSLTATSPSNPPTISSLEGPVTGVPDVSYELTATATDPDGDQIRYEFDWNNDGVADQYAPASGTVASGTPATLPYTWISDGVYTIRARAVDTNGSVSDWASHTITIVEDADTLTLCLNGVKPETSPISLTIGEYRNLTAHYGEEGDCTDSDVTASTSFSDDADLSPVALSGTDPVKVEATQADSTPETVTATHSASGSSGSLQFLVGSPASPPPAEEEQSSDTNWREVTPGE